MQLSEGVEISHPYFAGVALDACVCEIFLCNDFPLEYRKFTLRVAPELWEGVVEVEGTLGLIEEGGRILWLHGSGYTFAQAIQNALATFTNWVVHPADVNASKFCLRPAAA